MKRTIEILSFLMIFGGSSIFGYLDNAAAMGLSIVAGAIGFALVNLDKFHVIKGAGFEATLREAVVEAVTEQMTEPNIDDEEWRSFADLKSLNEDVRKVAEALENQQYKWRYMAGLKKATGLSAGQVENALRWLIAHGFVKQSYGKHGQIWSLTEDGVKLVLIADFDELA